MPHIGSNSVDAGAVAERLRTLTTAATPSESHSANFIGDQQNAQKVYEETQYSPAWVREGQATPQAITVISAIESSQQKGLNPEDYDASHWPERMAALKAAPGKADIYAYVSRIDPQATFTPENTYFRDDRVKQVVGLKLQLIGGFGFAKPGMPVDGEVLVQGDKWPKVRRK